jgi:TrmH family RNA methyltransferase
VAPEGGADPDVESVVSRGLGVGIRVFDLAPGVLARVAGTVTPQPVLAIVGMLDVELDTLVPAGGLVVVCADVRDPGNAGTVLRSADAAGARAVVCAGGTVDPYNPKVVRASAGSLFHLPVIVSSDSVDTLSSLETWGYRTLGAAARGGEDYVGVDWSVPTALVLGNEACGLSSAVQGAVRSLVSIPMAGRAESLNVGVAGALLCFEAYRQRRRLAGPGPSPTMPGMPTCPVPR